MKAASSIAAALAIVSGASSTAEIITNTNTFFITEDGETEWGIAMPLPSEEASTAVRIYTGQIVATYSFDSETLEFQSFTFANDNPYSYFEIYTRPPVTIPPPVPLPPPQPYQLQLGTFVDYPTGPAFNYIVREAFAGSDQIILFRPETTATTGSITASGALDNSEHVYFTFYGNMVTGRAIKGVAQPAVRVEYSLVPQNLPMLGTVTPSLSEVNTTIYKRTLLAVLTFVLDERNPTTLPGNIPSLDLVIDETEVGTYFANTGLFNIPTAYGSWATDNDLKDPDPDDTNPAGIDYGILFALDLPSTATSLPISTADAPGPTVRIDLPASGLTNPMSLEYSTTMMESDWEPLPTEYYLDGADSLDLGATGSPSFRFPPDDLGFIRFVTTIE